MKSVIDHLDIVSTAANDMICYLAYISSAPRDRVASVRTKAELFRALAKYCSEQANNAEDMIPQLLLVEQELQEKRQQQELQQQEELQQQQQELQQQEEPQQQEELQQQQQQEQPEPDRVKPN